MPAIALRILADKSTASYWLQIRQAERMILSGAFAALDGDVDAMSAALGVPARWLRDRMNQLGGCRPDEPVHEPPRPSLFSPYDADGNRVNGPRPEPPPKPKRVRRARQHAQPSHVDPPAALETRDPDPPADSGG